VITTIFSNVPNGNCTVLLSNCFQWATILMFYKLDHLTVLHAVTSPLDTTYICLWHSSNVPLYACIPSFKRKGNSHTQQPFCDANVYLLLCHCIVFVPCFTGNLKKIPVGARFFAYVQTGPGAHPASCTTDTGSFPGVKWPGRGADHPPPPSAEVENE
jgi:hypothetical protein